MKIIDCTDINIKDIPKQLELEYDQGDKCIVYYDDLYDLIEEAIKPNSILGGYRQLPRPKGHGL